MMRNKPELQFTGLASSVNPFSAAPELANAILDNCLIRSKDLIEPFRGYTASAANPSGNIARVFPWLSRIITFSTDNHLRDFSDASGWSGAYSQPASNNWGSQPTFPPPDGTNPQRSALASKSMFFTSSAGVKVLDGLGNSVRDAGIPAPYIDAVAVSTGSGTTWLQNGWTVAYRAVLGRVDANGNTILSAPSNYFSVTNTLGGGAVANTAVELTLPVNVNGATFVQLYRTVQSNNAAGPGDEMFLVQETLVSSLTADATLGSYGLYAFNDFTSDNNGSGSSFLGTPLYTNPVDGGGLNSANDQPPLARDLCLYNGSMLYANTTERHSLELQLIGTDGLAGGVSTIIIGGVTYIMESGAFITGVDCDPAASPPQFRLHTGGTPSQNIDLTARSLVNVVNLYNFKHGGNIQAFYLSTANTMPGLMLFQEVGVGGNAFTISVGQNAQVCWSPDMSTNSITLTSSNDRQPSRIWWSSTNEPWAVPPDNWEQVGAADQDILRIVLVRQTVFIFKKDGLYTLTGNTPTSFVVTPFDPCLVLLAPETCCVVNNQIFCLTNRGYVYVNESGASPSLSWAWDRDLTSIEYNFGTYPTVSFGVAYEGDSLAFLALPAAPSVSVSAQQYVFNAGNPSWSRLLIPGTTHGCFDPARQALCWAVGATLYEERKLINGTDIQWPALVGTAGATTNSNTVVVTGAVVAVGDVLAQSGHDFVVLAVAGNGPYTCTIDGTYSFSSGNVAVFKAISCHMRFLPWGDGDPTQLKRFTSVYLAFAKSSFENFTVGFNSESTPTFDSRTLAGPNAAGLGGQDSEVAEILIRADVSQNVGQAAMLGLDIVIQQAASFWQLQGVRFVYDGATATPVR